MKIQQLNTNTKIRVDVEENFSEEILCSIGIKQGDSLCPIQYNYGRNIR